MTDRHPFFLVADSRGGFHLLTSLLYSTGKIEYIGHSLTELPSSPTDNEILELFEFLYKEYSRGGVYGTKVEIYWLSTVIRYFQLKGIPFNSVKWIRLYRNNPIRQAISMVNAAKTGQFVLLKTASEEKRNKNSELVDITLKEVASNVLKYNALKVFWQNFFDSHDIRPYTVVYERIVNPSTWETEVRNILHFLEIDSREIGVISTNYLKMSDDAQVERLEREFIERYTKLDLSLLIEEECSFLR